MENFSGNDDIWMHIRFGEPVPARTFPDPEAARAYVLSGPRAYPGPDLQQIHRLRHSLVAAPQHMGGIAAACRELLVLGDKARAVQDECRRRYFGMALLFCVAVLGFAILHRNLGPLAFVMWRLWNGGILLQQA